MPYRRLEIRGTCKRIGREAFQLEHIVLALNRVMQTRTEQSELAGLEKPRPDGLIYEPDFITAAEEIALLSAIRQLPLLEARYKVFTAKRRIASFGSEYDFDNNALAPAPSLPPFLERLRDQVAEWLDVPAPQFAHALVTEYRLGTALGWHRDAPNFGFVVGVSLAGRGRMRFRPFPPKNTKREDVFVLDLEPRSVYVSEGQRSLALAT